MDFILLITQLSVRSARIILSEVELRLAPALVFPGFLFQPVFTKSRYWFTTLKPMEL